MSSTGSTDPTVPGRGDDATDTAASGLDGDDGLDGGDADERLDGLDRGDVELRAARRAVALFGVALAAAAVGAISLIVGARGDDGAPDLSEVAPGLAATTPSAAGDERIGPPAGADVAEYVADRQDALTDLDGAVTAVVSLTGYSTPATVEDLVDDVDLDSYLVAWVGDRSRRTDDLDALAERVAAAAEKDLVELESIAPTVDDDDPFARFYAEEIDRYRSLLEELDQDDVVFGLVVTGQAADLRALASRASVRLVDARAGTLLDEGVTVTGLRPEQRTTVGDPELRP